MQTQTLPIQVSGASASAAPQRANANQASDSAQFSQALSREMKERQPSPAPAAARPAPQAKPAEARPATASTDASTDEAGNDADDAVAADAAAGPVADMLALVAGFNLPAAAVAGGAGKQADADALAGASAPALPDATLAADGKGAPLKEVIDGAARFSMKALGAAAGDAQPKLAEAAAPKSMLATETAPRAAASSGKLAALAGAAQTPDADGAAAAAAKLNTRADATLATAAPRPDAAPRVREGVADIAALKEPAVASPVMVQLQQASAATVQAITGAPTDRIAARVGTPGWDSQVGQKIIWMVAGKEQSASLTLNPPDLGPMQVVLNVTNDQATVTFSAAQPEVRQALENAMPKLREMMGESGIALGNATVNAGTPDQRQAQQGEQSRGQGHGGRFGAGADSALIPADLPRQARLDSGMGLVDTFA